MQRRPSLLFVAPIVPAQSGNGLAMRAGVFLDAFARDFQVSLLVVPVAGNAGDRVSSFVDERACRIVVLSLDDKLDPLWELCSRVLDADKRAAAWVEYPRPAFCRYATTPCLNEARRAFDEVRFDAVHVMRSYLAPYAAPFLPDRTVADSPFTSLDLDDDEAVTHRGLATLLERMGSPRDAHVEAAESAKYERHEAIWLPRFRQLITCSAADAQKFARVYRDHIVEPIANTVVVPQRVSRRPPRGKRVLFVGNLSYLPSVDGICWFAREMLPRLRAKRGDTVLRIAGSAPSPEVVALTGLHGVELVMNPADVTKHYAWADLAVIPLRAGGGTRIKMLEAFAHGVPVVATPIGAEGIAADHGAHVLLADSSEAFTNACVEVMSDAALATRLSSNARQLVERHYGHERGVQSIRHLFSDCHAA